MEYAEILHRCFRCGFCKLPGDYSNLNCPPYLQYRFETYSPGGRMWLLRAWLDKDILTSPRLSEILFSCTACGNCVEHCAFPGFKENILKAFTAGRGALVDEGMIPPAARDYFKAIQAYGNPYKLPEAERGEWARGLDLESYTHQDYLFYTGCVGSYDERGRQMARSVAGMLKRFGLSFGILGAEERCEGNEVNTMGERGLFEHLADRNIRQFRELGIRKVIVLSPHGFHALKNEYPGLGGDFEVYHYSQILAQSIGDQKFHSYNKELRVTYHDPCYLGRHNREYQAPRNILKAIPGVALVEMQRNMSDALCCGGGGGNFFTDMIGVGPDSPARVRVREAAETGAEVLAVACPTCAKMLEDAVKAESQDGRLRVMDLSEIIAPFLKNADSKEGKS
jgi:Fe-S oxidoreductase